MPKATKKGVVTFASRASFMTQLRHEVSQKFLLSFFLFLFLFLFLFFLPQQFIHGSRKTTKDTDLKLHTYTIDISTQYPFNFFVTLNFDLDL